MSTSRQKQEAQQKKIHIDKSQLASYWSEQDPKKQISLFSSILQSIPFPFYVIDANTYEIILSNQTTFAGQSATCYQVSHHRDTPCKGMDHPCGLEMVKRSGESVDVEHIHYNSEGIPRNVEVYSHPIFDRNGDVVQVIEYSVDVTERRQSQKDLERLSNELKTIYNLTPIMMCVVDEERRILHSNQEFRDFFGLSKDESLGIQAFGEMGCEHYHPPENGCPAEAECATCSLLNTMEDTFKTGEAHRNIEQYMKFYRKGRLKEVVLLGSTSLIPGQEKTKLLLVLQDITGMKKTERELLNSREEALRASRAKSEFLSSMSHELRTPLNAILGFSQLMEMDPELSDGHRDYMKKILGAGQHLLSLIDEVLDLSRVDTGQVDLNPEVVSCGKLVEECLQMVATNAAKRGIKLDKKILQECYVEADRIRLKQVLMNLLSNAVKYNIDNGSVLISVYVKSRRVRFEIADTGPGIPEEKLAQLFEPFSRLGAEATEVEGTGIGLNLSKRLIEMMGGSIGVQSEAGKGSSFWIDLPSAFIADQANKDKFEGEESSANVANSVQNEESALHTVLYIEDDQLNLRLMEQTLGKREHIRLISANSSIGGLEKAEAEHPELVLLDLNMPDLDGFEALKRIRQQEWGRDVPVFAVTAHVLPEDVQKGLDAGFTEYITKPLDIPTLFHKIDQKLGKKE